MSLSYRPEIDGLRAIAISSVIAYHFGVSQLSGGFLGVDIFFVISGYLISSIILREMQQGDFSFRKFYLRRIRRIFPALFCMMLISWPLAYQLLLPEQFEEFSKSLIYVTLFVSNLFFAARTGYFDTAIELKPLIHTWSLAVEEQYYLFFPLLLIFLARKSQRWLIILSMLAILSGFAFSIWQPLGKTFGFFSVSTRIWEFFFGFLASLLVLQGKAPRAAFLDYLGLSLIVFAFIYSDESFLHPGWITIPPVLGCWLLIINQNGNSLVFNLLVCKPVRIIGLMSYSLYLWHQPLLAFYRYHQLVNVNSRYLGVLFLLLIVVSWLSWQFIETPFRNRKLISDRKLTLVAIGLSVLILGIGYYGQASDGLPNRFHMPEVFQHQFERRNEAQNCQPIPDTAFKSCSLGADSENANITMAVFGDSHALALIPAFDKLGKQNQIQFILAAESACPPIQGVFVLNGHSADYCQRLADAQWEMLKHYPKIKQVIWVAKWASYTDGNYQGGQLNWLGTQARVEKNLKTTRQVFNDAVRHTAERYKAEGLSLAVLLQVPQQLQDIKQVYYRIYEQQDSQVQSIMLRNYAVPVTKHLQLQSFNRGVFMQLAEEGLLEVINPDGWFCDDVCRFGVEDQSWYRDSDHLNSIGAQTIAGHLAESLNLMTNKDATKETAKNVN